jgi:hypothetical protein
MVRRFIRLAMVMFSIITFRRVLKNFILRDQHSMVLLQEF